MRKAFFTVMLALAAGCAVESGSMPAGGKGESDTSVTVIRVIDGDTLEIEGGERVRLIGIDTPEVHESAKLYRDSRRTNRDVAAIKKMGKRSSEFVRQMAEGKRVRLEFDVEKRDRYGRLLAYVFLSDGTFVNAAIVEAGYASPMTYPPNIKYADEFVRLYRQARDNRRGLWQDD